VNDQNALGSKKLKTCLKGIFHILTIIYLVIVWSTKGQFNICIKIEINKK